jgi:hypothetical protein
MMSFVNGDLSAFSHKHRRVTTSFDPSFQRSLRNQVHIDNEKQVLYTPAQTQTDKAFGFLFSSLNVASCSQQLQAEGYTEKSESNLYPLSQLQS